MPAATECQAEYQSRESNWTTQHNRADRSFVALGNWRLFTAIAAVALIWLTFAKGNAAPWPIPAILAICVFIALRFLLHRVRHRRDFASRAIKFYKQAINRTQDNWSGNGNQGDYLKDPNHPYSDDLDLFGRGGLFELVCVARTAAGERSLATWLRAPASLAEATDRQSAVRELAPKLDLREEMALLGEDVKSPVLAETLAAWGTLPHVRFPAPLRIASLILSVAGLVALVLKFNSIWPLWPLLSILAVNATIMFVFRAQTAQIHHSIETAAHKLSLLSLLIERLERETFLCPRLARLRAALATNSTPASRCIKHLDRWLELLDSSDHIILRVLNPVTLYKQQIVMAVEAWRAQNGASIGNWVEALAEFEALSSLASLHFERPDWCFPTFDEFAPPHFAATNLGHPLIPAATSIRNALELNSTSRLLIVSGSNMSGKSTLLRAVGLNTVLAWAGGPVCATALHLSPLQVGASLRTSDSLQDNRSRFFAEISRLRQIVDLTRHSIPVLFLLDELLSGTNSHDRRIGAAGVVRGLLAARTIGMLTTHDLALTQLDQEPAFHAVNVHLEDKIIDGKIEFDYHLRPGIVTHSNALELMRSIGLQI